MGFSLTLIIPPLPLLTLSILCCVAPWETAPLSQQGEALPRFLRFYYQEGRFSEVLNRTDSNCISEVDPP